MDISRRNFAKASAMASFGILTAATGKAKTNKGTIKIGLIGAGGRGTGAVMDCLEGNKDLDVKLVAAADAFEDRLKDPQSGFAKIAKHPKVDVKPDMMFVGLDAYKKLLGTDVDMIIHATPPYARPDHIDAAVEAGKHVFTEKPVGVDPAGVRKFIEAAKKAEKKKLSFVCGTQRRHQKEYVETIKKIQDGAIGEIVAARAYWCGSLPFSHERKPGWSDLEYRLRKWYNQCWTCGDNIVEQHVHNMDVINWVLGGPPVAVFASGGRAWKPAEERYGDTYDSFSCDYEYKNNVFVTSLSRHFNEAAEGVFEWVKGSKGISNCHDLGEKGTNPYQQEHIDSLASILETGPYLNEGVRCAESTMTVIMGRMSAYTGKKYTWDEALNEDLDIVPKDLDFAKSYPVGPIPVPGKKNA